MRKIFLLMLSFSIGLLLVSFVSCSTTVNEFPVGSLENPLVLDDYSESMIMYYGTIGNEELYIKVINIPYFNNDHTVELQADGALDLYTYSDAFGTLQDSSTSSSGPIYYASCIGTTTATGELYIMIDGTKATYSTNYTLVAST